MPGKISTDSDGIDAAPASVDFFDKALAFVVDNPANYYLVINQDYTAQTEKTAMATGITLTIVGIGSERTITSNTGNGRIFNINNGAQLYLENNVTLKGKVTNSTQPFISITDGTLNMNDGSKITGYTGNNANGMIYVDGPTSSFNMNGGEISGNRSDLTTGATGIVRLIRSGIFTMNDGTIKGNTVAASEAACIYIDSSSEAGRSFFIMYGGTITGNTNTNANYGTGGVYVGRFSTFTMHGGSITNNTANATTGASNRNGAGGVYIHATTSGWNGGFYMFGGSITGNISPMGDVYNAGVYADTTAANSNLHLRGNATIGTLTSINRTNGPLISVFAADYNNPWTGSVQVLNLYFDNTNFTSVANAFIDKQIIFAYRGVISLAEIDKFKKFNFLNSNLVEQDISLQGKGIVKSGAKIGYMTP
jgi:hypothetical protein